MRMRIMRGRGGIRCDEMSSACVESTDCSIIRANVLRGIHRKVALKMRSNECTPSSHVLIAFPVASEFLLSLDCSICACSHANPL